MTVVEKAVAVKDEAVRFFLDKYYRHTKGMDKRRKSQNEAVAQAARRGSVVDADPPRLLRAAWRIHTMC